jgi:hypothetical protein
MIGNIYRHTIHAQMTDLKKGTKIDPPKRSRKSRGDGSRQGGTVTQLGVMDIPYKKSLNDVWTIGTLPLGRAFT